MEANLREQAQRALQEALEPRGVKAAVAREVGLTPKAVSKWTVCNERYLEVVERVTGVPRAVLRPDLAELFGSTAAE